MSENSWTDDYDAVFWITLATILCGSLGLAMKLCMKSKCERLSLCCGLVDVERNVQLELASERLSAAASAARHRDPDSTPSSAALSDEGLDENLARV
jgi:hypothetical protein